MFKNKSVSAHDFAMVPRADIPRSAFRMQHVHKTSFNASYLVPIYWDEMYPGDTFNMKVTGFVRLATPLFPTLDNLHLDTFWFFIPNRLVWDNWQRFMGERSPNPDSSISYMVPYVDSPDLGPEVGSLMDYMGVPTVGQAYVPGGASRCNALPFRAYNLVYNEWFRDQNLQGSITVDTDDGPDTYANYTVRKRGKRHDYFTSALTAPQKGTAVTVPFATTAPVVSTGVSITLANPANTRSVGLNMTSGSNAPTYSNSTVAATGEATFGADGVTVGSLEVDLATATAATINQLRQAFQIQRLLERDARGGTRYTELVLAHFGVHSPDARLQRPEYLGGSSDLIQINPVAQTSATSADGTDTPQGNLSAVGTGLVRTGFTYSAVEHGIVLGIANVRADITYQQGLSRKFSRQTRYDYYWPAFAHLGEQGIRNQEIYKTGNGVVDDAIFGYQERYAELRYFPSMVTSLMRSTAANTIDPWHYSQEFSSMPSLNDAFITDATEEVLARSLAVGSEANGQQLLADFFFDNRAVRPMPMYGVPGGIDRF